MDLIGVVVFIVVVILSLASKAQEARKLAERERQKQQNPPQQLSEKARQKIHGRVQPKTATARQGQVPPAVPQARPVRKPRPVEQELLETLFGVKLSADDEGPAGPPPNVKEATQQMVQRLRGEAQPQPRPAAAKRTAPPPVSAPDDEGPTVTAADVLKKERDFERRAREASEQFRRNVRKGLAQTTSKPKPGAQTQGSRSAQTPGKQPATQAQRPRTKPVAARLFGSRDEIVRAIIASEVLGPPKSMRDDSSAA